MRKMNPYVSPETEVRVRQQELAEQEAAEKRAKKNFNFVQIEKKSLRLVRELYDQNATAGRLLFILAEKMNRQNALVCSYDTMSKITGFGRTALYNAVRHLKDNNWIQIIKVGTANAYVINSRVFWQSYGDKKMTVFHATIMTSSDEQDEPVENWDKVELKHFPFLSHDEEMVMAGNNEKAPPPDQIEIDYHAFMKESQ
jgi:hypothetical protein